MQSTLSVTSGFFFWSGLSGEQVLLGLLLLAAAAAGYFYYRMRREDAAERAALDRELERRLKSIEEGARETPAPERNNEANQIHGPFTHKPIEEASPEIVRAEPAVNSAAEVLAQSFEPDIGRLQAHGSQRIESTPPAAIGQANSDESSPPALPSAPQTEVAVPTSVIAIVEAQGPRDSAVPHAEQVVLTSRTESPASQHPAGSLEEPDESEAPREAEQPVCLDTKPLDPRALRPVMSAALSPESLPASSKRVLHRPARLEMRDAPFAGPATTPGEPAMPAQNSMPASPARIKNAESTRASSPLPFGGLQIFADPAVAERAREDLLRELNKEDRRRRQRRIVALSTLGVLFIAGGLVFAIPASRNRVMPRLRPYADQLAVLFGIKAPQELVQTIRPDVEFSDYRIRTNTKANTFEFGGEVTNVSSEPLSSLQIEIELQPRGKDSAPSVQVIPLDPPILAPGLTGTFHFGGSAKEFQSAKVGRVLGPGREALRVRYKGIKEWPVSPEKPVHTVSAAFQ